MTKRQWNSPTGRTYKVKDPMDRFKTKYVEHLDGCFLWMAATRKAGRGFVYGQFSLNGYPEWAHRAAWQLHFGPIPEGMQVCHTCDNPLCVNPAHLFLGTQLDNMHDMLKKGRDAVVGTRNHMAILDPTAVRTIRDLAGTISQQKLANHFEVHRWTVQDVIHKKTWTHI